MNAQAKHIALAECTTAELRALRTRLLTQRRQEQSAARRVDATIGRIAAAVGRGETVAARYATAA